MIPKDFLLKECENVRSTLKDVLRHDYAAGSSRDFYNEFSRRIDSLESFIGPADSTDTSALGMFAIELSRLSSLVHHMERSHAGEFPWPFTEYLQDLATPLCTEHLAENEGQPIIRVYAEGGLFSYQINLEDDLSVLDVGRRIFTIVFPRTLKHHVLLHAIFGHEIGHAAWTIPQHQAELKNRVLRPLKASGRLSSTSQATLWLQDPNAPPAVVDLRNQYDPSYSQIDHTKYDLWFQEFMCDLVGLVTFGGSFLAAHQTLLLSLDPTGYQWGPSHPPFVCRKAMLWHACKHLKWDQFPSTIKDPKLRKDVDAFVNSYSGPAQPGAWEDVFTQQQVGEAVDALVSIFNTAGTTCFVMPEEATLRPLVQMLDAQIPPCGSDLSGAETPVNRGVDFRHILMAGWLVAERANGSAGTQPDFMQLNKLCEMGLLQQRAIDLCRSAAGGGIS